MSEPSINDSEAKLDEATPKWYACSRFLWSATQRGPQCNVTREKNTRIIHGMKSLKERWLPLPLKNAGSVAVLGRARCHTHELNKAWWRLGTKWICDVLLERTGARRASFENAKPVWLHAYDGKETITNKGRVVILTDAQSLRVTTESLATQWSHQFALHLIH